MDRGFIVVLCIIFFPDVVQCNFKHWKHSTNFLDGDNWNAGRPPCQNDRVTFPETIPPVFIQNNASVLELVLPNDGEFILGDYVSISFPAQSGSDKSCQGQDLTFTRTEAKSWFDPDNWCQALDPEGECLASQPLVLDTEKVPCKHDGITFPPKKTFLVNIPSDVDVSVSSLNLGGKSYTTGTFRRYLQSNHGKQQFKYEGNKPRLNIQDNRCSDQSGCACGNDEGVIQEKICTFMSGKCPSVQCSTPIRPRGSCCDMCGAVMLLDYDQTFKMSNLKNLVDDIIEDTNNDIPYMVSKTSRDQIQLVLHDNGEGSQAILVAKSIEQRLKRDVKERNRYGTTAVETDTSQHQLPGAPAAQTSKQVGGGMMVGIIVAILLFLAAVGVALFCFLVPSRRRMASSSIKKAFHNFGRSNSEGGLELSSSIAFKEPHVSLGGFENPMYDTPMKYSNGVNMENVHPSMIDPQYKPQMSSENIEQNEGYENPLYGKGPVEEIHSEDPGVRFNPVFSAEGLEEDSSI